jgi:hypothetical protein
LLVDLPFWMDNHVKKGHGNRKQLMVATLSKAQSYLELN